MANVEQAALLDTDVFSALYVTSRETGLKKGHPIDDWTSALTGVRPLIAFQTRAELLAGAYMANWGHHKVFSLQGQLDLTPTVDEDQEVVEAYARLHADARKMGHPLGHKGNHVGDRWIAACAIAKGLPLLTGNRRHFANAPGLALL